MKEVFERERGNRVKNCAYCLYLQCFDDCCSVQLPDSKGLLVELRHLAVDVLIGKA
jgi:hypothetical protein